MFGSKKGPQDSTPQSAQTTSPSATNSIVQGTQINGDIKANNDIRIDGKLVGNLNCKGKVIIGPEGVVDGEIICENSVIEGNFTGILKVKNSLIVKENAKVNGTVDTENLQVHAGAKFNVSCTTDHSKPSGQQEQPKVNKKNPEPVSV